MTVSILAAWAVVFIAAAIAWCAEDIMRTVREIRDILKKGKNGDE